MQKWHEEATEGERSLSARWESLGLEMQKWHGCTLRIAGARNGMGGGYGGGASFECTLRIAGAGDAEIAWEEATEGSEA